MSVAIFCESQNGKLKKGSTELLTSARKSGEEAVAILIGPGSEDAAKGLSEFGVTTAYVCSSDELSDYNSSLYAPVLTAAIKESGANSVLASSTLMAKDLLPRVAAQLETGIASDCTELEWKDGSWLVKKPLFAGKCKAQVDFTGSPIPIIMMRPNQLPAEAGGSGDVEIKSIELISSELKLSVKEVKQGESNQADLTEANIIVSGGRGLKEADNFQLLQDLAGTLGATVGASRAVADAGWVPHSMQVGQTGKTVAPSLYIACGISGAIQHLAGMSGSKVIVAINTDPDAPIFGKATYGIVGDLFEVVPKLKEEFETALN